MDEMAERLALDPIELRLRNEPAIATRSRTSRSRTAASLRRCLHAAPSASAGPSASPSRAAVREGRWLVGLGMAAALRDNLLMRGGRAGRAPARRPGVVETDMTDIGTGTYTIIAQTAAEMMGVPVGRRGDASSAIPTCRRSRLGRVLGRGLDRDGRLPRLREAARAASPRRCGVDADQAELCSRTAAPRRRPLTALAAGRRTWACRPTASQAGQRQEVLRQATFGAHFVEVGVDVATGEIRVRRMLGVCAAGRILNPKTARPSASAA